MADTTIRPVRSSFDADDKWTKTGDTDDARMGD